MINLALQTDQEAKANVFVWFPSFKSNDPNVNYSV